MSNSQTEVCFAVDKNWLKQDDTNASIPLYVPKLDPEMSILLRPFVATNGYKNGGTYLNKVLNDEIIDGSETIVDVFRMGTPVLVRSRMKLSLHHREASEVELVERILAE